MRTRTKAAHDSSALNKFTRTAEVAADDVIRQYSTSFGLATRLLGSRHRTHVRNIYAMVRVADEIVDGVAEEAGLDPAEREAVLDDYIARTHEAMRTGYSTDLVLHAFALTARESGIGEDLTQPFFDSMRADLAGADAEGPVAYDEAAHASYVYGSAEVVGLMCVRVFVRDETLTDAQQAEVAAGARALGAAFQNINFLRDLADDTERLGRSYLSGEGRLTAADKDAWIATIRQQLADARATIPLLPHDARAAVRAALNLFEGLTDRADATGIDELYGTRVRVPNTAKAWLTARAVMTTWRERT